jgi:hypothetical protein
VGTSYVSARCHRLGTAGRSYASGRCVRMLPKPAALVDWSAVHATCDASSCPIRTQAPSGTGYGNAVLVGGMDSGAVAGRAHAPACRVAAPPDSTTTRTPRSAMHLEESLSPPGRRGLRADEIAILRRVTRGGADEAPEAVKRGSMLRDGPFVELQLREECATKKVLASRLSTRVSRAIPTASEPSREVLTRSPCPRSAGERARGSAERGQAHARGSARTGRVTRDGAQRKRARREALTEPVARGARAHGGAEAHDGAVCEGGRDAWRRVRGSAAARTDRGRG